MDLGNRFSPDNVVSSLEEEPKLLHVLVDLVLELVEVLVATALHFGVVVEQDVRDVQVVLARLVMSLQIGNVARYSID